MRLSRLASIALLLIPGIVFAQQHSASAGASASGAYSSATFAGANSSPAASYATSNSPARSGENSLASNVTAAQSDNKKPQKPVLTDSKKPQKPASEVAARQSCAPTPACPAGSFLGGDGKCAQGMAPDTNQCPAGQFWDGLQCKAPINNCPQSTTASAKGGARK